MGELKVEEIVGKLILLRTVSELNQKDSHARYCLSLDQTRPSLQHLIDFSHKLFFV